MKIVLNMIPPTTTSQMKGERVIAPRGKKPFVHHYKKPELLAIEDSYKKHLLPYKPSVPFAGPVSLMSIFVWPYRKTEKRSVVNAGALIWKDTKPDADNSYKLLGDCMEAVGFFANDCQVCNLNPLKFWGPEAKIVILVEPAEDPERYVNLVNPRKSVQGSLL